MATRRSWHFSDSEDNFVCFFLPPIAFDARALIFAKIITKEEMNGNGSDFPHTRNEYETIRLVRPLSLTDCQDLFFRTKSLSTIEAAAVVREHVAGAAVLN